jgi:hypothetical protein
MTTMVRFAHEETDAQNGTKTLIDYAERKAEYAILVHNDKKSSIPISFCPWCGTYLGRNGRKR